MSKKLDPRVEKILKELGLDPKECLWLCHGQTWVMYHRFIEIAGAKHGIKCELFPIETNSLEKCVCIKCKAHFTKNPKMMQGELRGEIVYTETFGEASPANNKNAYPYAMAEKRAIDRAILKLLGLHGFIYSEDEMPQKEEYKETYSGTEGFLEGLTPAEQAEAKITAEFMITAYINNDVDAAYNEFYNKGYSGDIQTAIWHLLKPESKLRRAVKQHRDTILNSKGEK